MAEKEKISANAQELLDKYNIDASNGVDIVALAVKMGFVVGNAGLDDNDDGFIMVNKDADEILGVKTKQLIGVNADRCFEDKRFIIAHELGHYVLHCNEDNIYAHRESRHGRNDDENDADFFAACLLMPADAFKKKFAEIKEERVSKKIKRLQEVFDVPFESVLRRIEELKLTFDK